MQDATLVYAVIDPTAIASISTAVVVFTQFIKWAGMPDRLGPVAVLGLSALGMGLWIVSNGGVAYSQLFEYFAAWGLIATSAAGVYGFTRASSEAITKTSSPPANGAGSSATKDMKDK